MVQSLSEISWSTHINLFSFTKNRKMRPFNTTRRELAQLQKECRAREQPEEDRLTQTGPPGQPSNQLLSSLRSLAFSASHFFATHPLITTFHFSN